MQPLQSAEGRAVATGAVVSQLMSTRTGYAYHNDLIGHNSSPTATTKSLTPQNQPESPFLRGNQTMKMRLRQNLASMSLPTIVPVIHWKLASEHAING